MRAGSYPTNQASVLASVLLARGGRVHEADVIEGAERRARTFDRPVPSEAAMREAIAALVDAGEVARDGDGWLSRKSADGTP